MQDVNSEEKILSLLPEFKEELYTCKTTEDGLSLIKNIIIYLCLMIYII